MTRHRVIVSVTGAATLAVALGLAASACVADGHDAASRRGWSGRGPATLALTRPADPEEALEPQGGRRGQAVDRMASAPDARAAARGPMDVTVYYLRSVGLTRYLTPEEHEVPFASSAAGVATSAVTELLAGRPRYLDVKRPFPSGTRLLDLDLDGGTATVNLSREALGGASGDGYALQALVWTATQVPQVRRVVVEIEGRSSGTLDGGELSELLGVGAGGRQLVRDRAARLAPILLDEPTPRALVEGGRVVVKGRARVASGMVGLRLRDPSGRVVSQSYAVLPSSAPSWAAFSGAISFPPPPQQQLWKVEAFESRPTDASVTYSVAVPVLVGG